MSDRRADIFSPPIAVATLATAGIHLYLAIRASSMAVRLGALASAVSFVGGLVALLVPPALPRRARPVGRFVLIGVVLAEMVGYVARMGLEFELLAIADKAIELALLILLITDWLATGSEGEISADENSIRAA